MAFSGLFSNRTVLVDDLFFDTHMRERHMRKVTATEHPVEFGANVVDNIIVQPSEIEMDVIVSDSQTMIGLAANAVARIAGGSPFSVLNRPADALKKLDQLKTNRQPLRVITGLATYEDVYLMSIDAVRSDQNQTTAEITLTFRQIPQVGLNTAFTGANGTQFGGVADRGYLQVSEVKQ